jgi:IS605 OrfB family transposase
VTATSPISISSPRLRADALGRNSGHHDSRDDARSSRPAITETGFGCATTGACTSRRSERSRLPGLGSCPRHPVSRKQPGSKNRERARLKVARVHEKVRHSRSDWIDKQVKTIVAENQGIFVEDLNVKGLSRSRLAKSIRDAAFGIFLSRLESKAARAGRAFVKVDRFFPSTQLCSTCGVLSGPRGIEQLGVRRWVCRCGARHERDANAELNIRREGQRVLAQRLWER